jgi:hypothetical protein
MDGRTAYDAWAPASAIWSDWARPVLFAQAADAPPDDAPPQTTALDLSWVDAREGNTAVVVDLPGAMSVELGLALAASGFRPVPLFNACDGRDAALDLKPIVHRLLDGAASLSQRALPDDAPPAFLLDSRRMEVAAPPPGKFDNRWLSFPQDFPSATRAPRRATTSPTRCAAGRRRGWKSSARSGTPLHRRPRSTCPAPPASVPPGTASSPSSACAATPPAASAPWCPSPAPAAEATLALLR